MRARWHSTFSEHLAQKRRSAADPILRDFFRRSGRDDLAAFRARFRPDIDDVIRFRDHAEIVLDHDHGVAFIDQPMQHFRSNSTSAMCSPIVGSSSR